MGLQNCISKEDPSGLNKYTTTRFHQGERYQQGTPMRTFLKDVFLAKERIFDSLYDSPVPVST